MIASVKALISIRYDININGAAFCTVISSAQFSHLNPSITPGNHQWKGAAPLIYIYIYIYISTKEYLSLQSRDDMSDLSSSQLCS